MFKLTVSTFDSSDVYPYPDIQAAWVELFKCLEDFEKRGYEEITNYWMHDRRGFVLKKGIFDFVRIEVTEG